MGLIENDRRRRIGISNAFCSRCLLLPYWQSSLAGSIALAYAVWWLHRVAMRELLRLALEQKSYAIGVIYFCRVPYLSHAPQDGRRDPSHLTLLDPLT